MDSQLQFVRENHALDLAFLRGGETLGERINALYEKAQADADQSTKDMEGYTPST